MMGLASQEMSKLSFLSQSVARAIDVALMGPEIGYSIDQLMELAGLSVALSVQRVFPSHSHPSVLVCAGPGNNGGDALVAARHLLLFGYSPVIHYPKRPHNPLFDRLVTQMNAFGIPFVNDLQQHVQNCDLIIDGVFGFSFSGTIRPPFDSVIQTIKTATKPIVSIDIPSGWHVEEGDATRDGIQPDVLVSLTAPKLGVKDHPFKRHFVGGRFVPNKLIEAFSLQLPCYPGGDQIVEI